MTDELPAVARAPESTDVPSEETQSANQEASTTENKVKSEVVLTKEEYEELLTAKGRASKEARENLKKEKELEELRRKVGPDEDNDPRLRELEERAKKAEEALMRENVARKASDKLANSILPESVKKLILNNPLALVSEDSLFSPKAAELELYELIEDLEKAEKLAKASEPKAPEAPEFQPNMTGTPPPPVTTGYDEAKKAGDIAGMIKAKLFGAR